MSELKKKCAESMSDGYHSYKCGKPAKFVVKTKDDPRRHVCGIHARTWKSRTWAKVTELV